MSVVSTFDGGAESFTEAVATEYKDRLAALLGVSPQQIRLVVTSASIRVEAFITVPSTASASAVAEQLTPSAIGAVASQVGLTALAVSEPVIRMPGDSPSSLLSPPPLPPSLPAQPQLPSPTADWAAEQLHSAASIEAATITGAVLGGVGGCCIFLASIAALVRRRRRQELTSSSSSTVLVGPASVSGLSSEVQVTVQPPNGPKTDPTKEDRPTAMAEMIVDVSASASRDTYV